LSSAISLPGSLVSWPPRWRASRAVLAIPIARAVRRGRDAQIRGACAAIVIASCVLMATTSVSLVPEATPTIALGVLAAIGSVALAIERVPPVAVILGCACFGLLLL
jgi:hypothetical protein